MSFPCTGCGLCCKRAGVAVLKARELIAAGTVDAYVQEVADFPYDFDSAGACLKLQDDNSCAVYNDRPNICSVDKTWERYHSKHISKENYYLSSVALCNAMIKDAGLSENFYL